MPVAVEVAGDLIAVLLILLAIAFLHGLKFTVTPIVQGLHAALGWVPGVDSLTNYVNNKITAALNDAISASEDVLNDLFKLLLWSFTEMENGIKDFVSLVRAALEYMIDTAVPGLIHELRVYIDDVLGILPHEYSTFSGWITHNYDALVGKITDTYDTLTGLIGDVPSRFDNIVAWVTHELGATLSSAETYADDAAKSAKNDAEAAARALVGDIPYPYDNVVGWVEHEAASAITTAKEVTSTAVENLRTAEDAAIQAAEAVAAGATATLRTETTAAIGAIAGAEGGIEGELANIEGGLTAAQVGALIASIPAISVLLNAVVTESGLDGEACRGKVKGICATNAENWTDMLAGLALFGTEMSFPDIVSAAEGMFSDAVTAVTSVAGVDVG